MNKTILELLQEKKKEKMPSIIESESEVQIELSAEDIQTKDMHDKMNSFEGWSFAAYSCIRDMSLSKKVVITLKEDEEFIYADGYKNEGNLCKFLYRIMKFKEQYGSWFDVSDYLQREMDKFKNEILPPSSILTNNIGGKIAKNGSGKECTVEGILAEGQRLKSVLKNVIKISDNPVYRQLAVGLFKDSVCKINSIFTQNRSAIDLWTWHESELDIVELKANNAKIDIVTEIFFYSNYMYDLLCSNGLFRLNEDENYIKTKKDLRGYNYLRENHFLKINGIMLADDKKGFHPWVNEDVLSIMNSNNGIGITYYKGTYPYEQYVEQ